VEEIRALTGLRWFAALAVFFFHFGLPSWSPSIFGNLQRNGALGVQFFFILSGYILTVRYVPKPPRFRKFLISRFARIGPMYYVALLIGVVYTVLSSNQLDLAALGLHVGALQAWTTDMDTATSFNGPAWTISVEFFFYCTFPFIVRVTQRQRDGLFRPILIMLAGTIVGASLSILHAVSYGPLPSELRDLPNSFVWSSVMPIRYLGLFVSGVGAGMLTISVQEASESNKLVTKILQPNFIVVALISLLVVFDLNSPQNALLSLFSNFWMGAIPVGLMLCSIHLHPNSQIARFLGIESLNFLGRMSYAFYILHVPVMMSIGLVAPHVRYEIKFLILLATAALSHKLIEDPLRNRINKISAAQRQSRLEIKPS
jgi:peptidoglycan/LPS O-acetylase OafA/YrhL